MVPTEYKIELLNKNNKTIKKVENIETIEKTFIKQNYNKNKFLNKKFSKRMDKKRKFKFSSKIRRNNFDNKKTANY